VIKCVFWRKSYFDIKIGMKEYAEKIVERGGEGVVLRAPGSLYENGRSHSILKYKVIFFYKFFFGM